MSRWGTPVWFGVAVVLAVAVAANGPAVAHTNDVEVDSQVSADGSVLVERAYSLVNGYLVVHRTNATGGLGDPVGHVRALKSNGVRHGFSIPVDVDAWAAWGANRSVWVALHREETGEGFDPADDPVQSGFGGQIAERVELARGDRAVVATARFEPQRLDTDAVTVHRVELDREGRLAIAVGDEGASGRIIGSTALEAGTHEDVTVDVDDAVFARRGRELTLTPRLYNGTGNGSAETAPITAGTDAVDTAFEVDRVGSLTVSNVTTSGAGTTDTGAAGGDGGTAVGADGTPAPATTEPLLVTPTPTETPGPTATGPTGKPGPTPTATGAPTPTPAATTPERSTTSGGGPGFSTVVAIAALVVGVAAWHRARERP